MVINKRHQGPFSEFYQWKLLAQVEAVVYFNKIRLTSPVTMALGSCSRQSYRRSLERKIEMEEKKKVANVRLKQWKCLLQLQSRILNNKHR